MLTTNSLFGSIVNFFNHGGLDMKDNNFPVAMFVVIFFFMLTPSCEINACERCLQTVNKIRRGLGLPAYIYDAGLTKDATANVRRRAREGCQGRHQSGSRMFPPLVPSLECEGCEGPGYSISMNEFMACGVHDGDAYNDGYIYAGAARARDQFGRDYNTLRMSRRPTSTYGRHKK